MDDHNHQIQSWDLTNVTLRPCSTRQPNDRHKCNRRYGKLNIYRRQTDPWAFACYRKTAPGPQIKWLIQLVLNKTDVYGVTTEGEALEEHGRHLGLF